MWNIHWVLTEHMHNMCVCRFFIKSIFKTFEENIVSYILITWQNHTNRRIHFWLYKWKKLHQKIHFMHNIFNIYLEMFPWIREMLNERTHCLMWALINKTNDWIHRQCSMSLCVCYRKQNEHVKMLTVQNLCLHYARLFVATNFRRSVINWINNNAHGTEAVNRHIVNFQQYILLTFSLDSDFWLCLCNTNVRWRFSAVYI